MESGCVVRLRRGREKPVLWGHPWIFSGAVKEITGYEEPGGLCTVEDERGNILATGYANTASRITVRVLARERVSIGAGFIANALENALHLRERAFGSSAVNSPSGAFRVVNAEGDYLPGLVVDRYGAGLVIQAHTAGMQKLKGLVVDELEKVFHPSFIYERADPHGAESEGFHPSEGCLKGRLAPKVEIEEDGARFLVDVVGGQKTGFYLDQRHNRAIVKSIASGASILNCFSYTGAFGVQAHLGGARHVVNVDVSEKALSLAREQIALNGIPMEKSALVAEDVFDYLRKDSESYDVVVLDPPKFAGSMAELDGAARGYKDINLNGLRRVKNGGFFASFSCSGAVSEDLFQKIVFGAARDAGRSVQIVRRLHADADHPVNLAHREGEYLKGLLLRVL